MRRLRTPIRRGVVVAAAFSVGLVVLLADPSAGVAATPQPWTFETGTLTAQPNANGDAELYVLNASGATQTITGAVGFATKTESLGAGLEFHLIAKCPSSPCYATAEVQSTSPDVVPSLEWEENAGQFQALSAGGFMLLGPHGSLGDALNSLSDTLTTAIGSLNTLTSSVGSLNTLTSGIGSQVSSQGTTLHGLSSSIAALQIAVTQNSQVDELTLRVSHLASQVSALGGDLKALEKLVKSSERRRR